MDRPTDHEFGTGVDGRRTSGMAADVGESAYNSSQRAMTAIVHVTPELQPMIGGIADYAAILGRAMSEREIRQHYLVASHAALAYKQCIRASFPQALVLDSTTSNDLLRGLRDLEAETVLLHYSGYGYAPRGAPFWLVERLGCWKELRAHHRLIVMFHETWASGLPWQSSFWLSPLQYWCVARIARLADAVVTNTSYYRARLESLLRPGTPIQVQPIFSNIGEPDAVPAFDEREPVCVLFGRGVTRRRTNERFRRHFDELRTLGIERLIEIGVEPEITARLEWPFPVESLGPRKTSEISAIMSRVKYGLFDCPVHVAGKSGVLAALAAHGIVPIHPEGEGTFEGLEFGRDTVNISAVSQVSDLRAARDGASVRAWYRKHRLDRQVSETWLRLLSREEL